MWRSRLPSLIAQREEKLKRKITQQEISEATGIRQPTISAWMNWSTFKRLDASIVAALSDYLECDPSELYEWVEEETESSEAVAVATA
jgi:transcriptional regulator with XRE-family HTH domain